MERCCKYFPNCEHTGRRPKNIGIIGHVGHGKNVATVLASDLELRKNNLKDAGILVDTTSSREPGIDSLKLSLARHPIIRKSINRKPVRGSNITKAKKKRK